MKKQFIYILLITLTTAIIIVAPAFLIGKKSSNENKNNEIAKFKIEDKEKPLLIVEPDNLTKDLGQMKVSEERTAEFILKNNGSQPLTIFRPRTSCDCTFGEIIFDSQKSPLFNMEMHNSFVLKQWQMNLEPGKQAVAKVLYRPSIMPVLGPVERSFLFDTNDPLHPGVELKIKAVVE